MLRPYSLLTGAILSSENKEGESLLNLIDEILKLRRKLGEPTEGTLGVRFREYCVTYANTANEHRRGPIKLAKQFLQEIEERF